MNMEMSGKSQELFQWILKYEVVHPLSRWRHVRFTPNSGHVQCASPCLLSAKSGYRVWNGKNKEAAKCSNLIGPLIAATGGSSAHE